MKNRFFLLICILAFQFCASSGGQNKPQTASDPNSVRGVTYTEYSTRKLEKGIEVSIPSGWTLKKEKNAKYGGNSYQFEKEGNGFIHNITLIVVSDKSLKLDKIKLFSPILNWVDNPELIKGFNFTNSMPFELENNVKQHQLFAAMLSFGAVYELIYEYKNGQVVLAYTTAATVPLLNSDEHNIEFLQTIKMLKSIRQVL